MAVEAKLVDEIGRRAEADFLAPQGIEGLRADAEFAAGQQVRHLLADVVLPAKALWRARVQEAAADADGKRLAVEIALGHLLKALAADDGADLFGRLAGLNRRQLQLVRGARAGNAAER